MPDASLRIMPARNISLWLTISASAGASRVVARWNRDRRIALIRRKTPNCNGELHLLFAVRLITRCSYHRPPCLFSPASRAGEPPFFAWPKKGGPKKGHPGAALFVHPWTKSACGPAGLADAPSLARRQVGAIHCAHPAGLFVRPAPQHRGP